jgi:hypothetical protein
MAFIVASVPEFVKRTRSKDGTRSHSDSANRTCGTVAPGKAVPFSSWRVTASRTRGCLYPRIKDVWLPVKSSSLLPSTSNNQHLSPSSRTTG